MNECLSITIPPGYGSVQSHPDGSLQVTFPVASMPDYSDLSRTFIGLGVGLMFRGRELHGDLKDKASNQDDAPAKRPH